MEKFNFEKINTDIENLENGKNPGLGIRDLQKDGINGKGVHIAVIDQKLDLEHEEYKESIESINYYDNSDKEEMSMHGPAVASILAGKSLGVAPKSRIHYYNVPGGGIKDNLNSHIKAIEDILKYNNTVQKENKINIISLSAGISEEVNVWEEIKNKARESGLILVDSSLYAREKFGYMCGGTEKDKENFDNYDFPSWYYKKSAELNLMEKSKCTIVPSDYRTRASSWTGVRNYEYDKQGGLSWSIPYFAGVIAMAMQIKPDITEEEFVKIFRKTTIVNKLGNNVINPKGIIDEVKIMKVKD